MTEETVHLIVRGKVQGVGFRWFVRETARRGELRGWVRNNVDGSVEILAAGDPECVDRLRVAVRRGPPGARVDAVEPVDGGEPADSLSRPFAVRK